MSNAPSRFFSRLLREHRRGSLLKLRELIPNRRHRLEGEMRRRAQVAYLGDGIGLCRVLGRFKMYVDTRDIGMASHLMLDGYWELWVTEFLADRLDRGMTVIDVGANLGYFTLIMAEMVGEHGTVHAFEPNPPIARLLRHSVHVNGFLSRVHIHPEALGDRDGTARLIVPENYPGGAALVPAGEGATEGLVPVRRLDSYAELLDADIIKIDAEGGERSIWAGMAGLLARGRPLTVLLEFVAARYDDPAGFLAEILAHGFALHRISETEPFAPVTPDAILSGPPDRDLMLVLIR
jgi:FkbM family methyltransferase